MKRLVFAGTTGSGSTRAMELSLKELLDQGLTVAYFGTENAGALTLEKKDYPNLIYRFTAPGHNHFRAQINELTKQCIRLALGADVVAFDKPEMHNYTTQLMDLFDQSNIKYVYSTQNINCSGSSSKNYS